MKILVTEGDSRLHEALLKALCDEYSALTVSRDVLLEPDKLIEIVTGCDAILHLMPTASELGDDFQTLDLVCRGTFNLMTAAKEAGIDKVIVGSSLALFDRHPASWKVDEQWRPRPHPVLEELIPWLAELSVREGTRAPATRVACLRFGKIVTEEQSNALPYDSRWLHIEDAVQAIQNALKFVAREESHKSWHVFHITAKGNGSKIRLGRARNSHIGYDPQHDFAEQRERTIEHNPSSNDPNISSKPWRETLCPADAIPSRPIKKVVIFGAGGPVAAELVRLLAPHYTLRITDLKPIAEIISENKRQSEFAPMPTLFGEPHETIQVDVRDAKQVEAACEEMDAIINCTVLRHDPVLAFHVNTIGAYHIGLAAVKHRIRRVVHTGPQMLTLAHLEGYAGQYDIPGNAPLRPGINLYGHSKFLGQEILRTFAEAYGLEVPVLLYSQFVNAEQDRWLHAMAITWGDSATALKCALEVGSLPSPYEVMHILADLPHEEFSPRSAWEILGWRSKEDMQHIWEREN